ncbi:hypothetical protein A2U01_0080718 [Trifolium medium]|uniref:Uncharacterized protein n=1 Tax=Trifolium medium TaxID=97028 RepID=A0A392TE75_9FABA|nr:hypothetical protein [Trifolium medium]
MPERFKDWKKRRSGGIGEILHASFQSVMSKFRPVSHHPDPKTNRFNSETPRFAAKLRYAFFTWGIGGF